MNLNEISIENIWEVEQDILDVIHKVCLDNNLKYSLAFGTLLGAVRHKGFIPWDDDIDIIMPRDDYEKLSKIWKNVAPKDYLLQDYNSDLDFTNNFIKIRKDHTTFLQLESEKEKKYHKGFFVDIFPCDRLATGILSKKIQYAACAVNLLYSRGYTSGSTGATGLLERILLKTDFSNYVKRRKMAEKIMRRWNNNTQSKFVIPCAIIACKNKFHLANLFDSMIQIEFNGKKYFATKEYDGFLKIEYGDYMQLPPEEERVWKHHPILVDFEHNYEELEK